MMDGMIAMEQKINEAALDMISYVFEEHSGLIEEIRISLRSGDLRGTKKGMFALLLKVVKYSMPDCDMEVWGSLGKCMFVKREMNAKEDGLILSYLVREIVFECVCSAYPGGYTDMEFIRKVMKKNDIRISEEEEKKLGGSLRAERKKANKSQSNFTDSIQAYRKKHSALKDRDRNEGQYIFPAVSYYKFPSEEFDFYIRNGRKDADESKGLRGRIQNVSYGRLKPYFDEEMEDDLRKYRKIRNKMRSKMSDEEIKLFIKVEQRRMDFIRKASIEQKEDKRFLIVGLWEAHYRLDLIQLFHQKKAPWVGEDYFHGMSEMLCLCIELICEEQGEIEDDLYNEKERNSILWDVILDIGNAMTFNLISNNFDIPPRITVEEIRLIWSHIRTFDEEAALKKLKENFVRPLIERDQHLDDFIKLNLWCNYRELSNKEERRLEKAFLVVFEFLKLLAIRSNDYKKDGIKGNGDKNSDIRIDVAELDKLKENLKRIGVDIEIDRFEKSYQGYHIEEYFPKRYENRYRDIRNRIKKLVAKRKMLSAKTIIEDYLNAILIKSNDVWYIPEERKKGSDGMLCDGLFEDIFFVLYPDHIVTMDIFDKKQAVRDLTQKYDFNKEIGF